MTGEAQWTHSRAANNSASPRIFLFKNELPLSDIPIFPLLIDDYGCDSVVEKTEFNKTETEPESFDSQPPFVRRCHQLLSQGDKLFGEHAAGIFI